MNRWRNCSTALSSDGQRATIPHNYQGRPSFTSVYFRPTSTRESTPANANNSVLAKNPWRSWIFWAEPKSARIFTSEILKMNPALRYFVSLTLKLASNQLHTSSSNSCQRSHSKLKGTIVRVLVEKNLTATMSVTWRSKFSAVLLQRQCASARLLLFSMTQTWTLFKVSDQVWISFVW